MIRWNPDGTPDLDDDGSPQRSGRRRTVRADRLSSDSKKDAEEHRKTERSDRVVTQARPSGQTEWSYNRLWWVLVGRSSDQRRQVRHPQELRPEWAVFFCSSLFVWYVALLVTGCGVEVASWTLVVALATGKLGLGGGRYSTSTDSFVFLVDPFWLRIFADFPHWRVSSEFFGVGDLFRTGALFATFAAGPWTSPRTPYFLAFDAYTEFFSRRVSPDFLVASAHGLSRLSWAGVWASALPHISAERDEL